MRNFWIPATRSPEADGSLPRKTWDDSRAAILGDRLVKRTTRDAMWTPQMPSDRLGRMAYSLGWQVGVTDGVKDVGRGGSQQGTSAMILIAPDARAGVLTNSDSSDAPGLATRLLRIVLGLSEREHKEVTVNPELFDSYLGTYQMGDFRMAIVRDGDRLFAEIRDRKIPLSAESARDHVIPNTDTRIIFQPDEGGRTKELILREGGTDSYLSRVN